jgi:hypothetical protein
MLAADPCSCVVRWHNDRSRAVVVSCEDVSAVGRYRVSLWTLLQTHLMGAAVADKLAETKTFARRVVEEDQMYRIKVWVERTGGRHDRALHDDMADLQRVRPQVGSAHVGTARRRDAKEGARFEKCPSWPGRALLGETIPHCVVVL